MTALDAGFAISVTTFSNYWAKPSSSYFGTFITN